HAFALDYEREAIVSLMYGANVLAVLGAGAVTVAQLPRRCGVAIEALRPALRILGERGLVSVAGRRAALTEAGAGALTDHEAIIASIEATWRAGGRPVDRLRSALEAILAPDAPLWPALEPPPESWRSSVPRPELLPAFPMPRQGGHPDGA
ncbi:MAG: hypothetical protein ACRDNJ_12220, partial [Solirubrobacteraceae bacterium]